MRKQRPSGEPREQRHSNPLAKLLSFLIRSFTWHRAAEHTSVKQAHLSHGWLFLDDSFPWPVSPLPWFLLSLNFSSQQSKALNIARHPAQRPGVQLSWNSSCSSSLVRRFPIPCPFTLFLLRGIPSFHVWLPTSHPPCKPCSTATNRMKLQWFPFTSP